MVCKKCEKSIKTAINNFRDIEIIRLSELCRGLRTINTKNGETRAQYLEVYKEKIDEIVEFVELTDIIITNCYSNHSTKKDEKKGDLNLMMVKYIRQKQENLGVEKYLMNVVKNDFLRNLKRWKMNPELLEKKTNYKKREKKSKIKKSPTNYKKREKKSKIKESSNNYTTINRNRSISNNPIKLRIELLRAALEDEKIMLEGHFVNESTIAIQDLKMRFKEGGKLLEIQNAYSKNSTFTKEELILDFLPGSLDVHKQRFIINLLDIENIDEIENIDLELEYSNTFLQQIETYNDQISLV